MIEYEGATHAFFNFEMHENKFFYETLLAVDRFLENMDILKENPL